MVYPGLFNSSYQPNPIELLSIHTPVDQLGPTLLGTMFVTLLQGVIFVQYYDYLLEFWHEKRWTKWLVHLATLLSTMKFIYIWWFTWDRYVTHYGDWAYVASFPILIVPIAISGAVPNAVCQLFYIVRGWSLSHNWLFVIPAVLALLVALGAASSQTWGATLVSRNDFNGVPLIITSSNVSLSASLICDVIITSFTCYHLVRKKTGFNHTDGLISRLIRYSIEAVVGPTIITMVNLILNNRTLDNSWFLMPSLALTQVYVCSLLYTVNARKNVGDRTLTGIVTGSLVSAAGKMSRTGLRGKAGMESMATPTSPINVWRGKSRRNTGHEYQLQERSNFSSPGVMVEVQTIHHEDKFMNLHAVSKEETEGDESYSGRGIFAV